MSYGLKQGLSWSEAKKEMNAGRSVTHPALLGLGEVLRLPRGKEWGLVKLGKFIRELRGVGRSSASPSEFDYTGSYEWRVVA